MTLQKERDFYFDKIMDYIHTQIGDILYDTIMKLHDVYPKQRFGQLICNYVCPDYRNEYPSILTNLIMDNFFYGIKDPFYEESKETYERLENAKIN